MKMILMTLISTQTIRRNMMISYQMMTNKIVLRKNKLFLGYFRSKNKENKMMKKNLKMMML